MSLIDDVEEALDLLSDANNELKNWIETIEEDGTSADYDMDTTKTLVNKIEGFLHDRG